MKNKILLPIILFATLALSACTGVNQAGQQSSNDQSPTSESTNPSSETSESESPSESETSSETIQYGVAITNKAALQAEWHVRESSRDIDINLTPAGNVALEIAKKNLRITSSNSEVVLANGVALTPVGEGTATITVEYYDAVDSVNLIVLAEKSEPEHVRATVDRKSVV